MFGRILCPVDPTESVAAQKALSVAHQLADIGGASVTLLAVVLDMPAMGGEYLPVDIQAKQVQETKDILAGLAADLGMPAGRVTTKVRLGRPHHEILEEADASQTDLIVMASHRPRLATYLLGSNAAHVVRHAKCSVMVVRREAE